jgi:hypothetical protein
VVAALLFRFDGVPLLTASQAARTSMLCASSSRSSTCVTIKNGEVGYRSQYLPHAKRALYHLSYIPVRKDAILISKEIDPRQVYHVTTTSVRTVLGSIVVSIPACHAGDPGSIPGQEDFPPPPPLNTQLKSRKLKGSNLRVRSHLLSRQAP